MDGVKVAIKVSLRNVLLNRKKNFIALISLVAGFMSVNLFEGYMKGAKELFEENYEQRFFYGDFVLHHQDAFKGSVFFDAKNYMTAHQQQVLLSELNRIKDVKAIVRKLHFTGMLQSGEASTQVMGEGHDVLEAKKIRGDKWAWNASGGRPIEANSNDTLVGEELGRLIGCKRSKGTEYLSEEGGYVPLIRELDCKAPYAQLNSTTIYGQANAIDLDVVGTSNILYRELDSRYLFITLDSAQRLLDTDSISFISIALNEGEDREEFLSRMGSFLAFNNLPLTISHWKESAFGDIYQQSMSFLNVLRFFFLIVILTIVLFSILTNQNRLVFERIKEIAILRSIGFKDHLIVQIFLMEVLILSVTGCLLGGLFSVVVSLITKKIGFFYLIGILSEEVPFMFSLSWNIFFRSSLVVIGLSLMAAYLPLKRAMKMTINEAFSAS